MLQKSDMDIIEILVDKKDFGPLLYKAKPFCPHSISPLYIYQG